MRTRTGWTPGVVAALVCSVVLACLALPGQTALAAEAPRTISTWAGGAGQGVAIDLSVYTGELTTRGPLVYMTDHEHRVVRALDTRTGRLQTVAGTGDSAQWAVHTPRMDGGPATASRLVAPRGVAVDGGGLVYVSDTEEGRIRRVETSGNITTFAGGGTHHPSEGDGGPASRATLSYNSSIAFDAGGNLYLLDHSGDKIRKVDVGGTISTIAGTYCGCVDPPRENVPATAADFHAGGIAIGPDGKVYIADGNLVTRIDADGMLRRVAGRGTGGLGDGGMAINATLGSVESLAFDAAGNLYMADASHNRIRKVDTAGVISTVAGGGAAADGLGDGGAATSAVLRNPLGVAVGPNGDLYVSDTDHRRLRKVSGGVITTVAGNGRSSDGGDGQRASDAQIALPLGIARDVAGNTYVADYLSHRVRKIDAAGRITTFAGTGQWGFAGDGGPAAAALIRGPRAVAVAPDGSVYIADYDNDRIRKVDPTGVISTVAGGGAAPVGDGGPATSVAVSEPSAVVVDKAGNLYFTDRNGRVRKVTRNGTISTFAGGGQLGENGDIGDGGPATSAYLHLTQGGGLAFDAFERLHVSEAGSGRVRRVDLNGHISAVAGRVGGGELAGPQRGSLASEVRIGDAGAMAFDTNGNLYVVNGWSRRVLRVDLSGHIHTFAGTGSLVTGMGDGGPASAARIDVSRGSGLAFDAAGNLYVAEANYRIRRIAQAGAPNHVFATGWNGLGQLGDRSTVDRSTAVQVSGISGVRAIAAGWYHTLAVRGDGSVWSWGWNGLGQLGDGTTTYRSSPVRVPGLSGIVAVAGGTFHSLALGADGRVWAWGWNGYGTLGDGSTTERHLPAPIDGLSDVQAIAAGSFHNVAVRHDGTVSAWGWNEFGQVAVDTAGIVTRPADVPGMSGASAVAAGAAHTLVVRRGESAGEIWAWGWNGLGQLGDGTTIDRRAPVKTLAFGAKVTAGPYHSIGSSSIFAAWGWNAYGLLGTGSTAPFVATPATVHSVSITGVTAGAFHNAAASPDGSVITWGWNGYGALGDGSLSTVVRPTRISSPTDVPLIAAGVLHTVMVAE